MDNFPGYYPLRWSEKDGQMKLILFNNDVLILYITCFLRKNHSCTCLVENIESFLFPLAVKYFKSDVVKVPRPPFEVKMGLFFKESGLRGLAMSRVTLVVLCLPQTSV